MAINKKLITFAKKADFLGANGINSATSADSNGLFGQIPAYSIVFIKETGEIWHNGTYFSPYFEKSGTSTSGVLTRDSSGSYWYKSFTLWGNTFDGTTVNINGNLDVGGKVTYGDSGISKKSSSISYLTFNTTSGGINVTGPLAVLNSGTTTFSVTETGILNATYALNTNSYFNTSYAQGQTWSAIKQFNTSGAQVSLDSTRPAIINIQATSFTTNTNWQPWVAAGDLSSKSSWGMGLGGDALFIGRIPYNNSTNALTNYWEFNNDGNIYVGANSSTSTRYKVYHEGNLPEYPNKSSWNYDDVYLKLSGGTLTGNLTITDLNSSYVWNANYNTGSYVRSIISIKQDGNTEIAKLGIYGKAANTLNYIYLGGNNYDGNNLRIYSDKVTWGDQQLVLTNDSRLSNARSNPNKLYIYKGSGTTEGTDKWTYDGSAEKSITLGTMAFANTSSYLALSGGTMTGAIKRLYSSASDDPALAVTSNNLDVWIWQVNSGSSAATGIADAGFGLKYIGTGSDANNNLTLYSNGYSVGSSDIAVFTTDQAGNITLAKTPKVGTNAVVLTNDSRLSNTRNTTNSLTFNNGGSGAASGTTFNGSAAVTVSYNTIGAAPANQGVGATILFDKTLTLVANTWTDTGIAGNNISERGTYVVQLYTGDTYQSNYFYYETFSGIMSWYPSDTNSTDSDEIYLHAAGHATNGHYLYLRTLRTSTGSGGLKLQIASDVAHDSKVFYFKFRKLI